MQPRPNHPSFWHKPIDVAIENKDHSSDSQLTETEATVSKSGNSDVDVNVMIDIDTMPIAFAILCLSLANKQLTNEEFESATIKLLELTEKYTKSKKEKKSNVKYFNDNIWRR